MADFPAGWYPQPDGTKRFWDGTGWTEHVIQPGQTPPPIQASSSQSLPVYPAGTVAPASPQGSAPRAKPWFTKKRVIIPAAALVLLVALVASQGGKGNPQSLTQPVASAPSSSTVEPTRTADPEPADDEATDEPSEDAGSSAYDATFGTFNVVSKNGHGDATVKLPADAIAGVVKLTHNGSSNFVASVLDSHNQPTTDLLVNEIGRYSGTTAYGLGMSDDGVKIKISADGSWTLRISPMSSAPQLSNSEKGKGDKVFLYDGEAVDFKITHKGRSNFVVNQVGDDFPNLAVNEIGKYSGVVPLNSGPSVVAVQADGAWTFVAE